MSGKRRLDASALASMAVGKRLSEPTARVNSVAAHESGVALYAAADDEALLVLDAPSGALTRVLHAKKYGVRCVTAMRSAAQVLSASANAWDHSLRLLVRSSGRESHARLCSVSHPLLACLDHPFDLVANLHALL